MKATQPATRTALPFLQLFDGPLDVIFSCLGLFDESIPANPLIAREWRKAHLCLSKSPPPRCPAPGHALVSLGLLNQSGYKKRVRNLAVSVYDLIPNTDEQLELFASPTHAVSEAMDKINDKFGEFVITPALMLGMEDIILDRIAFGGVKELEEIYSG